MSNSALVETGQTLMNTLKEWESKLKQHVAISVPETEAFSKSCAAWLQRIDEFQKDNAEKAQRFTEEQMHEYNDLGKRLHTHSTNLKYWLTTFKNPELNGPHDWEVTRERIHHHITRCFERIIEQERMLFKAVTRFRDDDLWVSDTDCNPYLIVS